MNGKSLLALMLLAVCAGWASAQTIAVHPLWGEPPEMTTMFYDVLLNAISDAPGSFFSSPIDLERNRPADVPEGGFPPYICPSPSVTHSASLAITGEVAEDDSGDYRLRVYLWEMDGSRLLVSDEMTASDRESCETQLPYFLEWILSNAGRETAVARTDSVNTISDYEPEKWLYMGLRVGAGTAGYFSPPEEEGSVERVVTTLLNFDAAVQVSLHLFSFLDIKAEPALVVDLKQASNKIDGLDGTYYKAALHIPVMLQLGLRGSRMKGGVFGGAYMYMPLLEKASENEDAFKEYFGEYTPVIPGIVGGLNIGWKAGPGFLFMDARFEYDGHWDKENKDDPNYRTMLKMSLGYEWGAFRKKSKAPARGVPEEPDYNSLDEDFL